MKKIYPIILLIIGLILIAICVLLNIDLVGESSEKVSQDIGESTNQYEELNDNLESTEQENQEDNALESEETTITADVIDKEEFIETENENKITDDNSETNTYTNSNKSNSNTKSTTESTSSTNSTANSTKSNSSNNTTTNSTKSNSSNSTTLNTTKSNTSNNSASSNNNNSTNTTTEETTTASIYDYPFDVNAIKKELITIGENLGLTHITSDDGVKITPSNSSWTSPITARKSFQGTNLEKALKEYVSYMPTYVYDYGGIKIKYFTIYVEDIGNGSYTFYFLY